MAEVFKAQVVDGKYEACVMCGKNTGVEVSEHIDNRLHYVSGAGQLCKECYNLL